MRYGLLITGIAVCIGIHQIWLSHATETVLSDDARLAIEIRCQDRHGDAAADCRRLHEKLYLAGTLDPEKTLRSYCTLARTVRWGTRPAPPEVCVQRYGGWQRG